MCSTPNSMIAPNFLGPVIPVPESKNELFISKIKLNEKLEMTLVLSQKHVAFFILSSYWHFNPEVPSWPSSRWCATEKCFKHSIILTYFHTFLPLLFIILFFWSRSKSWAEANGLKKVSTEKIATKSIILLFIIPLCSPQTFQTNKQETD